MQAKRQFEEFIEELSPKMQQRLFREILYSDLVGINITDDKGQTVFLNDAHSRITGQPKELYLEHTMAELEAMGLVSPSAVVQVLASGKPVTLQQTVESGKSFEVRGTPLLDEKGDLLMVLCLLTDVTDVVQSQKTISEIEEYVSNLQQALENEGQMIFQSRVMRKLMEKAKMVAETDVSILITGPSGVGKEMMADVIHEHSRRKDRPFVKLNCAAIPDTLIESELFGYEPGAFTGGNPKGKTGLIEAADGGTLLLDEIAELPITLQSKLLRTLQSRTIRHLGGTTDIPVDFRLISSTNVDLQEMIQEKRFRDDLYYRVNVIDLPIPPLAERREDIPLLINHYILLFNTKYERRKKIDKEALQILSEYDYPGNVRELRNIVERLFVQSSREEITVKDIYEGMDSYFSDRGGKEKVLPLVNRNQGLSLKEIMEREEKQLLEEYIKVYHSGSALARQLKTDQSTISRKLNKYGIRY